MHLTFLNMAISSKKWTGIHVFLRHAFLDEMGESFHKRDTKTMMRRVKHFAENKMKLATKIKTVQCDASYPWPAGKAPWSLEMGGNGIPPQAKHPLPSPRARAASVISTPQPPTLLPAPGSFQKPRNAEEAQKMLELARQMMEKVADFAKKEHTISAEEAVVIKQAFNVGSKGPL